MYARMDSLYCSCMTSGGDERKLMAVAAVACPGTVEVSVELCAFYRPFLDGDGVLGVELSWYREQAVRRRGSSCTCESFGPRRRRVP